MAQKIHLNTLLDTMIMTLSCHYAWNFHKLLVMLKNLRVIQQCPLKLVTNNCWKSTMNNGKKVEKLLKTEFDSKPVYGDDGKYIKTKIKT